MKNIRVFLSENCHFLVVKFSVYLNRHVFVMTGTGLLLRGQNLPWKIVSRLTDWLDMTITVLTGL